MTHKLITKMFWIENDVMIYYISLFIAYLYQISLHFHDKKSYELFKVISHVLVRKRNTCTKKK